MSATREWGIGLAEWVWRSSCDASLLAAIVLAVQHLLGKRLAPAWRHALWMLVVFRLICPVFPASTLSVFNLVRRPAAIPHDAQRTALAPGLPGEVAGEPVSAPLVSGGGGSAATPLVPAGRTTWWLDAWGHSSGSDRPVEKTRDMLAWIWFGVAFCLLVRLLIHNGAFAWRLVRTRESAPAALDDLMDQCRREIGLARPVQLWMTSAVRNPAIFGFFRPAVLLPAGLATRANPTELRHVFLHELAHIRRHDMAIHWVVAGLEVMHWFNPILLYSFACMRADRELACDALALARADRAAWRHYGETLIKFATQVSQRPELAESIGILGHKGILKQRIAAIAAPRRTPHARWMMLTVMGGLSLTTLTDARVSSPSSPGRSDTQATGLVRAGSPVHGKAVEVRVIDERSGRPLPAGWLRVMLKSGPTQPSDSALYACDPTGTAHISIPFLPPHFLVTIEASHAGKTTRSVTWSPFHHDSWRDIPKSYVLKLAESSAIGGRVVDARGVPVAGARISMHLPGSWTRAVRERLVPGGEEHYELTDAAGCWRCEHMPSAVAGWIFLITPPHSTQAAFVQATADSAGRPTPGAILEQALKQRTAMIQLTTQSSVVPPHSAAATPSQLQELHSNLDFANAWAVLSVPPVRIHGRVLDFDTGQPIREIAVRLLEKPDTAERAGLQIRDRGVTAYGTNGTFHVLLLRPQLEYALEVGAEGYAPFTSAWAEPEAGRARTFRLRRREPAYAPAGRRTSNPAGLVATVTAHSTSTRNQPMRIR